MKVAIILSVLATISSFGLGEAAVNNDGTAAIIKLKSTTQNTTNDLKQYGNKLSSDLRATLSNLKVGQWQTVRNVSDPTIADVRSLIATANANGTAAEHCFEPARLRVAAARLDTFDELDKCSETGEATIKPVESDIAATVLRGNDIVNDLLFIDMQCYSTDATAMNNCIIPKIANASASVEAFQTTVEELKKTGDSLYPTIRATAFKCALDAPTKLRQEATSVRIDTKNCINNS